MGVRLCTCGLDLTVKPSGHGLGCSHCDVPCVRAGAETLCVRCDRLGIKRPQ